MPGLIRDEPHHARALLPGNLDITSPSSLHDSLTRRAWESQARATTTPRVDACVTHDVSYACGTYCRVHPPKRAGAQSGQQPAGRPARRRAPGPGRDVQSLQRHGVLVVPWRRVREWRGGTQSRSWRARPRKARRPTERYVMTSRVESTRRDETPGVAPCSVLLVAFRGDRGCRSLARHGRAAAGQDNATRARQSDPMDVGAEGTESRALPKTPAARFGPPTATGREDTRTYSLSHASLLFSVAPREKENKHKSSQRAPATQQIRQRESALFLAHPGAWRACFFCR